MANSENGKPAADYARPGAGVAIADAGRLTFRPGLWPTLAVVVLVPTFVSLGLWQWRKAEAKSALQALLDTRSREPAVQLPTVPADAESLRYRRVVVRGEYEPRFQILLDNRVYRETAGYHVLTPLRIAGSDMRVLVNRGWVPALADHSLTPAITTPTGIVEVSGLATLPSTKFFTLGGPQPTGGPWQPVWQNLDLDAYRRVAPFPMQPLTILLDPESTAGGYVREWPRPDERIERHVGYAWQWFGFAFATVAIWIFVNLKRR